MPTLAKRNALILSFLTCLILPIAIYTQEIQSVAILDLEGRGISALEAASLTDRLRSELVKTGSVTVVERGQMNQILEEQDFQMTGCTSDECAVEVGQLLGVSQMIAGSIGKLGNTFLVDVRIIDIQTGAIVETMTRNYRGEIDGLIEQIESLAWDIVGRPRMDEIITAEEAPEQPAAPQKQVQPKKRSRLLLYTAGIILIGGGGAAAWWLLNGGGELPDIPLPPGLPGVQ